MTVYQDFFEGGAGEERTLRANTDAYDRRRIIPRVLRGTGPRDLRTTLLGTEMSMPLLLAPTAFHLLAHPSGETGTATAAAAAGIPMVVSMAATQPIEQIAASRGIGERDQAIADLKLEWIDVEQVLHPFRRRLDRGRRHMCGDVTRLLTIDRALADLGPTRDDRPGPECAGERQER